MFVLVSWVPVALLCLGPLVRSGVWFACFLIPQTLPELCFLLGWSALPLGVGIKHWVGKTDILPSTRNYSLPPSIDSSVVTHSTQICSCNM